MSFFPVVRSSVRRHGSCGCHSPPIYCARTQSILERLDPRARGDEASRRRSAPHLNAAHTHGYLLVVHPHTPPLHSLSRDGSTTAD
jgi:hypothetical protein